MRLSNARPRYTTHAVARLAIYVVSLTLAGNGLLQAATPASTKPTDPTTAKPSAAPATTQPAAAASVPANQALAIKLWSLINGDKTLATIKAGLGHDETQLSLALDRTMSEKIQAVLDQALTPVPQLVQEHIAQKGNPEHLSAIVKWLESPFGKKVREAEAKANMQYNDLDRTVPLKEPKFSKEREVLYKRYESLAYTTTNQFIGEIVEFYLVVNNHTKPPTERTPPKDFDQALKLNRVKMANITQQLLPHLFAGTYREMIVDELKVYIDFLETEPGRAYLALVTEGFVNALQKTRPDVLLKLASIFEDELAVLSPYSKEPLSEAKQRQLMTTMVKRFGKPPLIGAILEMRGGQITIVRGGAEQEVYGRPNQDLVSVDTLMKDLRKSNIDIRRYYQVVQKRIRAGQ